MGVVLLGTPAVVLAVARLRGCPPGTAVALALALAQVGEFSFILAAAGRAFGVLPDDAGQAVVFAAIVSISLNPVLYRLAGPLTNWAARRPRLWGWLAGRAGPDLGPAPAPAADLGAGYRAVVVGYGPVGRTVCRLLRENGIEPTVVELNADAVRRLRAGGTGAVYGDAAHRATLAAAGVGRAGTLILTSSGMGASGEVIRLARELNPDVRVLARSAYVRELPALTAAGAEAVFAGEGEVALALTEAILRRLGATPEQVDRERERVRVELAAGQVGAYSRDDDHSPEPLLPEPEVPPGAGGEVSEWPRPG